MHYGAALVGCSVLLFGSACAGSGVTSPTPVVPRANLAISSLTVEPKQFGAGYSYNLRIGVSNSGDAPATVQRVTYGIVVDNVTVRSADLSGFAALGSPTIAPGATATSPPMVFFIMVDDPPAQGYATAITATLTYWDSVEQKTVTRSVPVPALQ
jgi:hypothetical protein